VLEVRGCHADGISQDLTIDPITTIGGGLERMKEARAQSQGLVETKVKSMTKMRKRERAVGRA
jgi:hypothetical protein